MCFLMLKIGKIGFQEALRKNSILERFFNEKLAVFEGARDAKMWFSLRRGAIFDTFRQMMLGSGSDAKM